MSNRNRLYIRFVEFGGIRLIWAYIKMGVIWIGIKAVLRCIIKRRPIKEAYPVITDYVDKKLMKEFNPLLHRLVEEHKGHALCESREDVPKIIWTCWLQGYEQAPSLVKVCIESQKKQFPEYEHRILTLNNYQEWVTLPKFIEEKYRKKRIPAALFSDLIRLAILKEYGGIWMDATVYCSGFENEKLRKRWQDIEQSNLTLFRFFRRKNEAPVGLSNWFIAAKPHHEVVDIALEMLYAYWRTYNCTVDYFIMHLFLGMIFRTLPEAIANMPKENSYHSLMLASVLAQDYNESWWEDVKAHVFIHKLNYRKEAEAAAVPNSFYRRIILGENI